MSVPFIGSASFIGPASDCKGYVGALSGYQGKEGEVSSDANGALSGTSVLPVTPGELLYVAVNHGQTDAACMDAFTGLPVPYAIGSAWNQPATEGGSVAVAMSPVSRLLVHVRTSIDMPVSLAAAYQLVGTDAAGADGGSLAALKSKDVATRYTAVKMLSADLALSSLVITAGATLAPLTDSSSSSSTASSPCGDAEGRAVATYDSMADMILSGSASTNSLAPLNLSSNGVCERVLLKTAQRCDPDGSLGLAQAAQARFTPACGLYYSVLAALAALPAGELAALPVEAAALAARVGYVVQVPGAKAVAALGSDSAAVDKLVRDWSNQLAAAPINLDGIVTSLGMSSLGSASDLVLRTKGAGALAQCAVSYRQTTDPTNPKTGTSDDKGATAIPSVYYGMATAAAGCRDTALSVKDKVVRSQYSLRALYPTGLTPAFLDSAAYLASAVFLAAQNTSAPRIISPDDYAKVYNYFGVAKPGDLDALPAGSDLIRQNWPSTAGLLSARVYILGLRVAGALTPSGIFVSGLVKGSRSIDEVVSHYVEVMARDLLAGTLAMETSAYLEGIMDSFYSKAVKEDEGKGGGARRRLAAAGYSVLDPTKLTELLGQVSSAVADASGLLAKLDADVAAAAARGETIDLAATLLQAAKIASVQQSALSNLLTQMAAAAASGDLAALAALQNTLVTSFSGAGLLNAVANADVDASGIVAGGSSGGGNNPGGVPTPTPSPSPSSNPGSTPSPEPNPNTGLDSSTTTPTPGAKTGVATSSGLSGGAIAGIVIGCVVGVALLALAAVLAVVQVRKRRAAQHVAQQGDSPAGGVRSSGTVATEQLDSVGPAPPSAGIDPEAAARLDAQAAADSKAEGYGRPAGPRASMDPPTIPNEAPRVPEDGESAGQSAVGRAGNDNGNPAGAVAEHREADVESGSAGDGDDDEDPARRASFTLIPPLTSPRSLYVSRSAAGAVSEATENHGSGERLFTPSARGRRVSAEAQSLAPPAAAPAPAADAERRAAYYTAAAASAAAAPALWASPRARPQLIAGGSAVAAVARDSPRDGSRNANAVFPEPSPRGADAAATPDASRQAGFEARERWWAQEQ